LTDVLANLHHSLNHWSRKEFASIFGNKIDVQVDSVNSVSCFM